MLISTERSFTASKQLHNSYLQYTLQTSLYIIIIIIVRTTIAHVHQYPSQYVDPASPKIVLELHMKRAFANALRSSSIHVHATRRHIMHAQGLIEKHYTCYAYCRPLDMSLSSYLRLSKCPWPF